MTDTDRLDWLEKNVFTLKNDQDKLPALSIPKAIIMRRTVRQAVDEAMRRK